MTSEKDEGKGRQYPKVSIIMPSFNGLELLKISIPSVLKTQYSNIEIIVIENGSSDDSGSLLSKEYPSVKVISLEKNVGISIAYALGVSAANGSLVSFLNNDMEVDPNWLLPLVLAMKCDACIAACDSKFMNFYERNRLDSSGASIDKYGNTVTRGRGEIDKGQFNIQEVFHGACLIRKDLLLKVGGLDKSFFSYYEETDLCWRLHRLGYKTIFVPESVIYHMGSASTVGKVFTKRPKKRPQKITVFHFCKNRLRMIIKNQFGMSLIFSVLVCLFDFCGSCIIWLLTDNSDYIPIIGKALIWNLQNLKGTLQERIRFKNESTDFNKLFLPYSGTWKTKRAML
jgi:GT2 family glycosyltransferase